MKKKSMFYHIFFILCLGIGFFTQEVHAQENAERSLREGKYLTNVSLEGGSGRASIESPMELYVDGEDYYLEVIWSSPNYTYMIVDGKTYYPVNKTGNSRFQIKVQDIEKPIPVIANTVAMSTPHEIEYVITVDTENISSRGVSVAMACFVFLAILIYNFGFVILNKKGIIAPVSNRKELEDEDSKD